MSESEQHVVEPGDCISKIAVEYGYTWKQIWNNSSNKALKKLRKDPNVLMPGDVVVIPPKKKKDKSKGTGGKHGFKRNKEQSVMKLRLLVDGEPVKNKSCKLEIPNEPPRMGRVNGNGDVEIEGSDRFTISSRVTYAELKVGDEPSVTVYKLNIGYLNPHDDTTGIQQRLNNLGFNCGAIDGNAGPRTDGAVRWFQREHKLKEDGEIDKKLKKKLKEAHGS